MLNWLRRFSTFCFLDDHQYHLYPHSHDWLAGAGVKREIRANAGSALEQFQEAIDKEKSWWMGHLGYDLKNEIEALESNHPDRIEFPDLYFFEPGIILQFSGDQLMIGAVDPEAIFEEILATGDESHPVETPPVTIRERISKQEYIRIIEGLRKHIQRGDCYEINFCQEFFSEDISLDPFTVYQQLSDISPNPFSALYRVNEQWLICASPERFLKKEGDRLISQPIKGTSRRVKEDEEKDAAEKEKLYQSPKDRSENVMVVDLVRNDLARVCEEGSVQVDELFGIYSFPQVHQMISTISGTIGKNVTFSEIIRACFPMGSMTGAPKKSVMQLIERYEKVKRGIFSGAVGYIRPDGDFDFNVVIRSMLYQSASKYLSFSVGSGITFYSEPEKEWEECMMKAAAIRKVLGGGV